MKTFILNLAQWIGIILALGWAISWAAFWISKSIGKGLKRGQWEAGIKSHE